MNCMHALLARRYAQAFLRVFPDVIQIDDINRVYACSHFLREHAHICFLLDLSLLPAQHKKEGLIKIFNRFDLSHNFLKLADMLIMHQRTFLLPRVLSSIVAMYKKKEHISFFVISSTQEVSLEQREIVEKFLTKKTANKLLCSYMIDKRLIAGIRMQSNTHLWEKSLQLRLRLLTNSLYY